MYRLRHIEADPIARQAVIEALAASPLPFAVEPVTDVTAPPPPAGERPVDAILLGGGGQADPLAAIGACRHDFPDPPIILLTEVADLAFARAALRAGAQDVVQQHERSLAVLSRILLYAIERAGAERRHRQLQAEAAGLKALLDALVAGPDTGSRAGPGTGTVEGLVQTDAAGGIERLSPAAAALLGTRRPPAPGTSLVECVDPRDRARLAAFLAAAAGPGAEPAVFAFAMQGTRRQLELAPIALAGTVEPAPRLFRVAAFEAAFGGEESGLATPMAAACQHPPAADTARPSPAASAATCAAPAGPSGLSGPGALAQLEALATTATWHCHATSGEAPPLGVLAADPTTAAVLDQLAAAAREDADLSLASDRLRLAAWRNLAAARAAALPARLLLEVGYATVASRPHYDRLMAAIQAEAADLAGRLQLVLQGVPKGIHVPTLAKTIRAMGTGLGRPGVQLPDLDADYRALPLGQLGLLVLTLADLKRTLAHDAKAAATLLARSRTEGCQSLVRGAAGALAEALRSRLGIGLTVAA